LPSSIQNLLISLFMPVIASIFAINFLVDVIGTRWETFLFGAVFSLILIGLSVIYIGRVILSFIKGQIKGQEVTEKTNGQSEFSWESISLLLLLCLYVLLIVLFKWLYATIFMTVSLMLFLGERKILRIILISSLIVGTLYLAFGIGLDMYFVNKI